MCETHRPVLVKFPRAQVISDQPVIRGRDVTLDVTRIMLIDGFDNDARICEVIYQGPLSDSVVRKLMLFADVKTVTEAAQRAMAYPASSVEVQAAG